MADALHALMSAERAATRAAGLAQEVERERLAYDELRLRKVDEQLDIDRLEGRSVERLLASMRGQHDLQLQEEQAELQIVLLEMAVHAEAQDQLMAELAAAEIDAAKLPAAREWFDAELALREAQLIAAGDQAGRDLAALADREIVLGSRLIEITEASDAAEGVAEVLARADRNLRRARVTSWVDMARGSMLSGEGIIRSSYKHKFFDDAAADIAEIHHGLARLRSELTDLDALREVEVHTPGVHLWNFDVWLDNIFADWLVHRRIIASVESVRAAAEHVDLLRRQLNERISLLGTELLGLDDQRVELLTA